jgi:Fe-S cluster assembly ATP-binding protein
MTEVLTINDLHVSVAGKPILKGVNLRIERGEIHALMGPNGSGKSTLGFAIMGHPNYDVTQGTITLDGQDILAMEPYQRARAGLFMAFQRPVAIPGVKMADFLRHATTNVRRPERKEGEELIPMRQFRKELKENMEELKMDMEFARRYVNDGFSGGEMKRAEILQMAMLRPKFAILDETDSGLDVDAVRPPRDGDPDHHPSRQAAGAQHTGFHPRIAGRTDRRERRRGTGCRAASQRLRSGSRRASRRGRR